MYTLARQSFSGVKTVVASTTSVVQLVPTNPSRTGLMVFNDSTAILSVSFTDVAGELTADGADIKIAAGGFVTAPVNWCGPVYGSWASADGNARIKEFK